MGSYRTFLIIAAAFAAPSLASAQEQEHIFVTGAMQDGEHVFVTGAMQDQEHIVVTGAAQDQENIVIVETGAANDGRRTVNRTASARPLENLPVVYEDEPAPARTQAPAPAARPTH